MNSKSFFLSFVIIIVFLNACKKDNGEITTSFLTSKTWKRALADKNTSTNPPGRILYDPRLDCQKDDIYQFSSDGTLRIDKGANKCNQNELNNETLAYTYKKDNKELLIDGKKYTLAEESNNQIKYYTRMPSITGYDYIVYLLE